VGVFTAILWWVRPWAGLLALVYGLVVAVGRIYVGKHWPTDILAGALLGVGMAWLWWRLVPRILPRLRPPGPPPTDPPGVAA
jgi:membrane-associated phospholipid phosphatase